MKLTSLILFSLLSLTCFCQLTSQTSNTKIENIKVDDLLTYNKWKFEHKKSYFNSEEASYRQILFLKNLKNIQLHNANKTHTYTKGVNQFTDLTQEEFVANFLNPVLNQTDKHRFLQNDGGKDGGKDGGQNCTDVKGCQTPPPPVIMPLYNVSQSIDWRQLGAISPVKNQGSCGSCWAFSAVALAESVNLLRNNSLAQYSEQELVDCTYKNPQYYNYGCQGGWPSSAYNYIQAQGISSQQNYPYIGANRNCSINSASPPKAFYAKNPIYYYTNNGNQTNLVQYAVNQAPISVLVDATNWSSYSQGVFNNCGNVTINHAVLLVGYDTSGNWLIKNSWGTNWGQKGYITLAPGNTCNVQSSPLGGL
ncbi:hypothetical protein ABPG74_019459 [Tetrahymena malaccensis]